VFQLELDDVSREWHDEVLDVSRTSELEQEVRAIDVDVKDRLFNILYMYGITPAIPPLQNADHVIHFTRLITCLWTCKFLLDGCNFKLTSN